MDLSCWEREKGPELELDTVNRPIHETVKVCVFLGPSCYVCLESGFWSRVVGGLDEQSFHPFSFFPPLSRVSFERIAEEANDAWSRLGWGLDGKRNGTCTYTHIHTKVKKQLASKGQSQAFRVQQAGFENTNLHGYSTVVDSTVVYLLSTRAWWGFWWGF